MSDSDTINQMQDELSRLRDLVREMREALEYYADFKSNTGHDGEYIVYLGCGRYQNDDGTRASEAIAKADAAIKEGGEPVKYGCYGINGFVYETCMLDTKDSDDCNFRGNDGLTDKATCPHWRPIK